MLRSGLLFASLATCASVHGAPGGDLATCRSIADDGERLRCYDKATAPLAADSTKAEAQAATEESAAEALPPTKLATPSSLLGQAWELDPEQRGHILRIRQYKPVYLLPYFHASSVNQTPHSPAAGHTVSESQGIRADEAKLQISLKTKLAEDLFGNNGDLWFGYTQTSRWQVYTAGISRPFRETNHEPELMMLWRTDYDLSGWRGRTIKLGINHQSNGRSLPLSRSWNRLMLSTDLEYNDWTLSLRPWWRIQEPGGQDDNPDISNYLGRGDLQLVKRWGEHQFSVLLRHSLRSGSNSHGAVQVDYAFPIAGELRGHLQWFSGYGESMIDYNHRANYFGVGVSLLEWY